MDFPVGKYTIAKSLHNVIPHSRLLDNHALIDLASAIEPVRNDAHHSVRKRLRSVLIESMIAVAAPDVFILTECSSSDESDVRKFLSTYSKNLLASLSFDTFECPMKG